jgi:hypothetical protein
MQKFDFDMLHGIDPTINGMFYLVNDVEPILNSIQQLKAENATLKKELDQRSYNNTITKMPTLKECYQNIPFPSDERECAMVVAGIADCHAYISRHLQS